MIVTAQKILHDPVFESPTVIMLVDRNELETQLFGNLTAASIGNIEVAESKRELQNLLASDYRGLIISMIHKFEGMPGKINTRDTIFILVDEAHRTTTGTLGNYLMGALPNATYFGFTGTLLTRLHTDRERSSRSGVTIHPMVILTNTVSQSLSAMALPSRSITLLPPMTCSLIGGLLKRNSLTLPIWKE